MKTTWKRATVLLITLAMVLTLVPAAVLVYAAEGDGVITRAEWITSLVEVFEMTVEDENCPDNYYSDLTGEEDYYRDILVATEFGVIDVAAGLPFQPEAPATREFAAHTLNFCLGFQLDEGAAYTYAESAAVTYPDDIQVAVNRGWFALTDGAFLPDQAITEAEMSVMTEDAASILAEDVVDEDFDSIYSFSANIIEIPEGTNAAKTEDNVITIRDCPVEIREGDFFAVYLSGIPCAFRADSVERQGAEYRIRATQLADEEAYTDITAEGAVYATFTQLEALDGTELIYVDGATGEEFTNPYVAERTMASRATVNLDRKLIASTEIELGDGLKASVKVTMKNPKIIFSIDWSKMSVFVKFVGDSDISYEVEFDSIGAVLDAAQIKEVRLINCVVPGVGGFVVAVDLELKGALSGTQSGYLVAGFQYGIVGGSRLIKEFTAKSFTIEVEASGKVGLNVKLGLTDFPVLKGYVYAKTGAQASLKHTIYGDNRSPRSCDHFAAYLYAEYGAITSISFLGLKSSADLKETVYDESNSPLRVVHHYEDGKEVPGCTRGGDSGYNGYFTTGNSNYWGSGWTGGRGSHGYNRGGEPICVYTYELNEDNQAVITGFAGNAASVVIPKTLDGYDVVAIGADAFRGNTKLKTVIMRDNILRVNHSAFRDCANLRSVTLSGNLTLIENEAFGGCVSLTELTLPDSLETLGIAAFRDCTGLKRVNIPRNMAAGAYAGENYMYPGPFVGCSSLTDVTFGEGITRIPAGLFYGCTGLTNVVVPDTVTEIEFAAFRECTSLKTVTFPDALTTISRNAFLGCEMLEEVTLPDSMETLGVAAFGDCTGLKRVNIPKNMAAGAYAGENYMYPGPFAGCSSLTDVTFGEGITRIPAGLFYECTGLTDIVIPDTVTQIEFAAFRACTSLKTVTFPDVLTTISGSAFLDCEMLEEAILPDSLRTLGGSAFADCTSLRKVYIPADMEGSAYMGENYMYPGPFGGCSSLADVSFGTGIQRIPTALFWNCTGPMKIVIPDTVTSINFRAFEGCTGMEEVTIPDGVLKIDRRAFTDCAALKAVEIPNSVTDMGASCFAGCSSLTSVRLPDIRNNITDSMFEGCTALETITLPETVEVICDSAFEGCTALKEVVWSKKLTTIESDAFRNCDAFTSVSIPAGVTAIGSNVFYDCDALETVTIPNSVTSLGSAAFYQCDALKNVSLSRNLSRIADSAFKECASLEEIVIPYNCTAIGKEAFNSSPRLAKVVTHGALAEIGSNAFSYADVTVFHGRPGSFTETWAGENGYAFVENTVKATAVTLGQTEIPLVKGASALLDLTVPPADAGDVITFVSSKPEVVSVDEAGKITAVGVGQATIKVYVGDFSASCKVTVTQAVTGIRLNKTRLELDVPETFQLEATIRPDDASNKTLTWTTSDESVATVDQNGLVTARGNGTVTITAAATDGSGISASCTVTVTDPANIPVTGIRLDQTSVSMESMEQVKLNAEIFPGNAADKTLVWTSSDEAIATVDENGLVIAVSKGTAAITAANPASGISAVCEVTVINHGIRVNSPEELESGHPYESDCRDFWIYTLEGAESLNVTFDAQTELEEDFDFLRLYDGAGNLVGEYTGTQLAGQTILVPGDTVKIKLETNGFDNQWGFRVTDITAQTETQTQGDVNGDANIDADDAIYLLYHTLFGDDLYPVSQECDYDGSGAVDADDAIYLLYYTLFGDALYPLA